MQASELLIAPSGWDPEDNNPFSENGEYGPHWSCFCLDDHHEQMNFSSKNKNDLYVFRLGRKTCRLQTCLADFLRYEKKQNRNVILSFPENFKVNEIRNFVNTALSETPPQETIRADDPKWVVHSTNLEAWNSIQSDNALKSLSMLRKENKKVKSVGFDQLREPQEFSQYIILGKIDLVNAEHVVASQQAGRIFTEPDIPYQPGIRLYFDNHKIIKKGLGVRDGLHLIKVHHSLPIEPYLVASVNVMDMRDYSKPVEWTPNSFFKAANDEFFKKLKSIQNVQNSR